MKKRLVAVILSLFMCTSMVSEAGAAAFTSPDAAVSDVETDTESIVTENTEESTDDVEAGDETEDLVSDFSSGAEEDNISDAADSNVQDNAQADCFSSGADDSAAVSDAAQKAASVQQVPVVSADGAVVVKAEDWVQTENGFKLKKAKEVVPAAKEAENKDASDTDGQEEKTADEAFRDDPEDVQEPENDADTVADAEQQPADSLDYNVKAQDMDAASGTDVTPDIDADVVSVADTVSDADVTADTNATADVNTDTTTDTDTTIDTSQNADDTQNTADSENAENYYTAADGIVKISTEYKDEVHTGYYLFDENGLMITGQAEVKDSVCAEVSAQTADAAAAADISADDSSAADTSSTDTDSEDISTEDQDPSDTEVQDQTESWFVTEEDAVLYTGCEGEAVTPYTSTLGQQLKNTWVWTGSVFQYYNKNGVKETISTLVKEAKAAGTYTGYFAINGEYYCLDKNGKPQTGNVTITVNGVSSRYYFEKDSTIPGRMFHEGWKQIEGRKGERWVYYNQGVKVPANIGKYYEHGVMVTDLAGAKGGRKYMLDKWGYLLRSIVKKAEDGAFYGTDKNGAIYTNTMVKYQNYRYYFGSNGKRVSWKNRWKKVGNHFYYFGAVPGRVSEKYGWQKIYTAKGKFVGWFYFDSKGNHYTNKTTSAGYYFTPLGKLASGLVERNGKKYIYEVSTESVRKGKLYKNTMVRYKKKWYLASSSGALYKTTWVQRNGNWYYFKNYVMQTSQFAKKNGVNGYLDSNGRYTTGWVVVSDAQNLVRYIDPDGNGYAVNTSKWINNVLYYFDSIGYRITDLTSRYTGPYYVEVEQANGVMTVYTDASRRIPVKTIRVSVGLPGTPTPYGTYTLRSSARWQPLMGPSWGQYGTHVEGAGQGGIFIHSVACGQANSFNLPAGEYNKLGSPASHGCIRTCVADAKWVYYHCNGATINIVQGQYTDSEVFKGPLGRNPLTPLRGDGNFDPTDPEV